MSERCLRLSRDSSRLRPAWLRIAIVISGAFILIAGSAAAEERRIHGKTITSDDLPKARITIRDRMPFIGSQKLDISGREVEQFIFAAKDGKGNLTRFCIVQFERDNQNDNFTYDYSHLRPARIGSLAINYDVTNFADLAAALQKDQESDGAAAVRLLCENHLYMSHKTTIARMYHVPAADHRSELAIIYGEALPTDTTFPYGEDIVSLDKILPKSAKMFFSRARRGLAIQAQ